MSNTANLTWYAASVTKADRRSKQGHGSCVLWFTGLSGSGKSSIANTVSAKLHRRGVREYVLDGDNIRHGLNRNLGFSDADRSENIRRVGEVAKLFVDSGTIVLTAFISPFRNDRAQVRALFEEGEFIEVFIYCSLEECERRDPKQLYAKARSGLIKDFTGIHSPYEQPDQPDLFINTESLTVEEAADTILNYLEEKNLI